MNVQPNYPNNFPSLISSHRKEKCWDAEDHFLLRVNDWMCVHGISFLTVMRRVHRCFSRGTRRRTFDFFPMVEPWKKKIQDKWEIFQVFTFFSHGLFLSSSFYLSPWRSGTATGTVAQRSRRRVPFSAFFFLLFFFFYFGRKNIEKCARFCLVDKSSRRTFFFRPPTMATTDKRETVDANIPTPDHEEKSELYRVIHQRKWCIIPDRFDDGKRWCKLFTKKAFFKCFVCHKKKGPSSVIRLEIRRRQEDKRQ